MSSYLVDVVIPTYREKGYIEATLGNLQNQLLYKNGKVHLVIGEYRDPISKDDKHLEDLCKSIPHCDYVRVPYKGIAFARNYVIQNGHIQSNIIMNFDADSKYNRTDAIDLMIRPILNDEAMMTNCSVVLFDDILGQPVERFPENMYELGHVIGNHLEKYIVARGPGLTIARYAYDAVGGFKDVPVGEDYRIAFDVVQMFGLLAKKYIPDVWVFTSDRRSKAFNKHGMASVDYNNYIPR